MQHCWRCSTTQSCRGLGTNCSSKHRPPGLKHKNDLRPSPHRRPMLICRLNSCAVHSKSCRACCMESTCSTQVTQRPTPDSATSKWSLPYGIMPPPTRRSPYTSWDYATAKGIPPHPQGIIPRTPQAGVTETFHRIEQRKQSSYSKR